MDGRLPVIGITTDFKVVDDEPSYSMDTVYAEAVTRYGGVPVYLPSLVLTEEGERALRSLVAKVDGVLLPGGRDIDPAYYGETPHEELRPMSKRRTEAEFAVLRYALEMRKPLLAVCNGMQTLNVFFGGSLYQHLPSQLEGAVEHGGGSVHEVRIARESRLGAVLGVPKVWVESFHHQGIRRLGKGLVAVGRSPDGLVEAVELAAAGGDAPFFVGVQWHPEREEREVSRKLFGAFIESCRRLGMGGRVVVGSAGGL